MMPGRRNAANAKPWCFAGMLLLLLSIATIRLEGCLAFTVSGGVVGSGPRYRLFTARYPLEGGPPQLRLHYAVVVESVAAKSCVLPNKYEDDDDDDERLVLFDFLPKEPTALPTTLRLLTGGNVEGKLRERELQFLPPGSVCVGESDCTLEDMREFVRAYPDRLSLISNSCFSFVDAFVEVHALNPPVDGGGA